MQYSRKALLLKFTSFPSVLSLSQKWRPSMTLYNPKQRYLIAAEAVSSLKPLREYELLFETLEPCLARYFPSKTRGRPPVSKETLLNALIYKNAKQLSTVIDLASTLIDNPSLGATSKKSLAASGGIEIIPSPIVTLSSLCGR